MITQKYNLSIEPDKVKPVVRVSQYDDSSRTIVFVIDYDFSDASVYVGDDEIACEIDGNEVSFLIDESLTGTAGDRQGEVVCDGVGTLNFVLSVEQTPLSLDLNRLRLMKYDSPSFFKPRLEPIKIDVKTELDDKIGKLDGKQEIGDQKQSEITEENSEITEENSEISEEIAEIENIEEESEVDDAQTGE